MTYSPETEECQQIIHSDWTRYQCRKRAKMMHEGKYYCGIHDPAKRAAKRAECDKKWKTQWDEEKNKLAVEKAQKAAFPKFLDAIQKIAAGHNDARKLCEKVLSETGFGEGM